MFKTKVVEREGEKERDRERERERKEVYLRTLIIILLYFPRNHTVIDSLYSLLDVRPQAEMVKVTDVLEEFGLCRRVRPKPS